MMIDTSSFLFNAVVPYVHAEYALHWLGAFAALVFIWASADLLSGIRRVRRHRKVQEERVQTELEQLRAQVKWLNDLCLEPLEREPEPRNTRTVWRSLNLTTRSKVLRLHRLGQSSTQIASTLELPLGEVNLLLKLHRIALEQLSGDSAGAPGGQNSVEKRAAFAIGSSEAA